MFDVIIVGAGTAGCVLAERLTRSGARRVMLVEALGGCSNMNAQIHQWCHPADFDGWAAGRASGWSWSDVAPVFREQECWSGEDGEPARGRAGLPSDPHYNGRAYAGAWIAELAHKSGKRFSAYNACLEPAMRRRNLEVVSGAHVTRIVMAGRRVSGVTVRRAGEEHTHAARAVVLSAGAYGSPQLLMLSGVGPAAALREHGIAVGVEAPEVGENLQDHPVMPVVFRARTTDTMLRAESPMELLKYVVAGRGMLASNGVEGFAFTHVGPDTSAAPDLELMLAPLEFRKQFLEVPREHAFSIAPAVVAPRSRGRVWLRSADPVAAPRIDPGLLTDPDGFDLAVLREGLRLARRIAATPPLAELNAGELRPGPAVESERDLVAYLSSEMQTVYHPTSTCRMGSDPGSVVDPRLRVRGVEGLWIADASVMPTIPRGHPNAVVAMIAHRAAGFVEEAME